MKRIWDLKIRKSVQDEFPGDPGMQELHELRLQKPFDSKKGILNSAGFKQAGWKLQKNKQGYYTIK